MNENKKKKIPIRTRADDDIDDRPIKAVFTE